MPQRLSAEVVSIGTELLLGQIVDTHAPSMARLLAECGIGCRRRTTVGDNFERIVQVLGESLDRSDVVVCIGGLGPTNDDLTREAIAAALDEPMVHEDAYESELRAWFAARGYTFAERNAKQADRPACGEMIANPNGTAPGLWCAKNGKTVIALPGPKNEFEPMAQGPVRTRLEQLGAGVIHSRVLRIIGLGESAVDEMLDDLMAGDNPTVAPYAHTGEVHLRVTARAETREAAETIIEPLHDEIASRLGRHLFGTDTTTLEEAIVLEFAATGRTLALAESMTGGQVAARLTSVPGASQVFRGGVVAYTQAAKETLLGVPEAMLAQFGPVSSEVAEVMARGVRERLHATVGLAITGNAGPTTEPGGQPVGKVFLAVVDGNAVRIEEGNYRGLREDIQRRAAQSALAMLR